MGVAVRLVKGMRAYHATPNAIERDATAARERHILLQHMRKNAKLRLVDVKELRTDEIGGPKHRPKTTFLFRAFKEERMVSSAWMRSAAKTWLRIASTSGIRVAAAAPTQSASVDTSMPSRR